MRHWQQRVGGLPAICAALIGIAFATPALAHPHVWVSVETTVVYEKGTVTGLRQRWTFDEFYSSMAIQGLDANNDGKYDRSELAELAKVNIEGLKDFAYFTFIRLGEQQLAVDAPTDFWMEHAEAPNAPDPAASWGAPGGTAPAKPSGQKPEGMPSQGGASFWSRLTGAMTGSEPAAEKPKVLSLEFTLPLKQPVLAEAEGLNFAVYDPSFFIWFDLVKDRPVLLADGAPPGCRGDIGVPSKDAAQIQQLSEAFFNQIGGANVGVGLAKTVTITCPK
jgi:ABC-type uncharacterized transport system substrate-binding protein